MTRRFVISALSALAMVTGIASIIGVSSAVEIAE